MTELSRNEEQEKPGITSVLTDNKGAVKQLLLNEARLSLELSEKGISFNTLQMYSGPASGPHSAGVFRIKAGEFEGDRLPIWKFPPLD